MKKLRFSFLFLRPRRGSKKNKDGAQKRTTRTGLKEKHQRPLSLCPFFSPTLLSLLEAKRERKKSRERGRKKGRKKRGRGGEKKVAGGADYWTTHRGVSLDQGVELLDNGLRQQVLLVCRRQDGPERERRWGEGGGEQRRRRVRERKKEKRRNVTPTQKNGKTLTSPGRPQWCAKSRCIPS